MQFGDALGFIEPIDIVPESLVLEREFSDGVPARVKIFLESGQAGELRFDFGYLLVNEIQNLLVADKTFCFSHRFSQCFKVSPTPLRAGV